MLRVHPFDRLRVADCGDVDVVPISIEGTFAAIERDPGSGGGGGCHAADRRRRPHDHAGRPARAGPAPWAPGAHPLRRASRHLGPLLRPALLPRQHLPARRRRKASSTGRAPSRWASAGRSTAPDDFDFQAAQGFEVIRIEDSEGARRGLGGGAARPAGRRARLLLVRHRRGGSRLCARPPERRRWAGSPPMRPSRSSVRSRPIDLRGADLVEVAPPYDGPGARSPGSSPPICYSSSSRSSRSPPSPARPTSSRRAIMPRVGVSHERARSPRFPSPAGLVVRSALGAAPAPVAVIEIEGAITPGDGAAREPGGGARPGRARPGAGHPARHPGRARALHALHRADASSTPRSR